MEAEDEILDRKEWNILSYRRNRTDNRDFSRFVRLKKNMYFKTTDFDIEINGNF